MSQPIDEAVALAYQELRAIAHHRLAARGRGGTLSTTALVHEAYLKLVDGRTRAHRSRALARRRLARDAPRPGGPRPRARDAQARRRSTGASRSTTRSSRVDAEPEALLQLDDAMEQLAGVGAATRPGRGVPLLRRAHRDGDRRGARPHGAHGAARLGEGARAAAARAGRLSVPTTGGRHGRAASPRRLGRAAVAGGCAARRAAGAERAALIAELSAGDPARRAELERASGRVRAGAGAARASGGRAIRRAVRGGASHAFPESPGGALSPDAGARPRRDGDGVSRARPEARPRRRGEGRASRRRLGAGRATASCARSRSSPSCTIRTSCRCTTPATRTGPLYFVMPYEPGASLARRGSRAKASSRSATSWSSCATCATRWRTRTQRGDRPSRHQAGQRAPLRAPRAWSRISASRRRRDGGDGAPGGTADGRTRHTGVHGAGADRRRAGRRSSRRHLLRRGARRTSCWRDGRRSPATTRQAVLSAHLDRAPLAARPRCGRTCPRRWPSS